MPKQEFPALGDVEAMLGKLPNIASFGKPPSCGHFLNQKRPMLTVDNIYLQEAGISGNNTSNLF